VPSQPRPLVYLDSCVYLDLVTRNRVAHKDTGDERWRAAKQVLDAVNSDRVRLAASPLVEAEVCCNGETRRRSQRVRDLVEGWFTARSTVWTEIDRFLAREAVEVMNSHRHEGVGDARMKTADALHLAAAVRLNCDFLMTHDEGYPHGYSISGVNVLRPQIVWQPDLWEHDQTG
jgi:predicted nucleic acid-binding protein